MMDIMKMQANSLFMADNKNFKDIYANSNIPPLTKSNILFNCYEAFDL